MKTNHNSINCTICCVSGDDKFLYYNHHGEHHYFCSDQCLAQFKENPRWFTNNNEYEYELSVKKQRPKSIKKQRIHFANLIDEKTERDGHAENKTRGNRNQMAQCRYRHYP